MNRRYTYFKGEKDKEFYTNSMKKYVENKQELDKYLEKLIAPYIEKKNLKILDACCGVGHICNLLSEISPNSSFWGFDQTEYLINEAKKMFNKKNMVFEVRDMYDVVKDFEKFFDVTVNWKTISWLPYYDELLKSLIKITKKHIFLSSLFYDGDIDFEIKVREYQKESGKDGFNLFYNVYSYPRFEKFVYNLGAKNVVANDFEINIDVPKPPKDQMGTYTIDLKNGKKLQVSGNVIMSWKIIRIDL